MGEFWASLGVSWWKGFLGGSDRKESACNEGDLGLIPVCGRSPAIGNGNPLQCSCLENPWTEELAGYSPQGHKESDRTEWLTQTHRTLAICWLQDAALIKVQTKTLSFLVFIESHLSVPWLLSRAFMLATLSSQVSFCSTCLIWETEVKLQDIRVSWNKVALMFILLRENKNYLHCKDETLSKWLYNLNLNCLLKNILNQVSSKGFQFQVELSRLGCFLNHILSSSRVPVFETFLWGTS